MRYPVDRRSIEVFMSLFTLEAAADAAIAPTLVATVSAILISYPVPSVMAVMAKLAGSLLALRRSQNR